MAKVTKKATQNTEAITDKRLLNLKEPWKKGEPSPNPSGRPKGQRNYATIYREALIKIASLENITPEDLEDDMVSVAIKEARSGDPIFYKDVMDRIHGKPVQPTDITSGGKAFTTDDIRTLLGTLNQEEQEEFYSILDRYVTIAERRRSLGEVSEAQTKRPRPNKGTVQG